MVYIIYAKNLGGLKLRGGEYIACTSSLSVSFTYIHIVIHTCMHILIISN